MGSGDRNWEKLVYYVGILVIHIATTTAAVNLRCLKVQVDHDAGHLAGMATRPRSEDEGHRNFETRLGTADELDEKVFSSLAHKLGAPVELIAACMEICQVGPS